MNVWNVVLAVWLGAAAAYAQLPDRDKLGTSDKYRILVDKVVSAANDWVFTPDHMKEIRDAGFNVVCPRVGGHELARCRKQTLMAQEAGLYHMAWMRGTLTAKAPPRLVWQDGTEQELCSPNSDELWDWTTELIVGHARISADLPAFIGTFLDYENYSKNSRGNCYALSYDSKILGEFAAAKELELPELAPAERYPWLVKQGIHDDFRAFQIASWRARCRELRKAVDAINPRFQFIVYPAPGTLFMREAIWHEWATPEAPLILADCCCYWRRSSDLGTALQTNHQQLMANMRSLTASGIPFLYAGGLDPICKGVDPEFCGRSAVMASDGTHGYWVFYEGPEYDKQHRAYFDWFRRANGEIVASRYGLFRDVERKAVIPEEVTIPAGSSYCGATLQPLTGDAMPADQKGAAFTVRGVHSYVVLARAGERIRGEVRVQRLGFYASGCAYGVFDPDGKEVAKGAAKVGEPALIDCPAVKSGVHQIVVDTGQNGGRVSLENQHFCHAGRDVALLMSQPSAWVYVMPEASKALLAVVGSPGARGESAAMAVFDPSGAQAARGETLDGGRFDAELDVAPAMGGKAWRVQFGRASMGVLEDFRCELGAGCSELIATHPTRLLIPAR